MGKEIQKGRRKGDKGGNKGELQKKDDHVDLWLNR